jgi:superfamily II DNA or RNA helicase
VHRKGLLGQAADRYELRTGDVAGRVGDGKWNVERFTVATFQTVARAVAKRDPRALALLRNAQGLVVDECHVLPANTFWSTVMEARDAYFRVGLSGTPIQRSDRRSMLAIAALGPVIYRLTARKLIDEGVLAEPIIRMLPVYQEVEAATWQGVYGKAIVRSTKRNKAVVEAVQRAEKPVLVFVKELKHGTELSARLTKAGLRVEFAHGKHSTTWRDNLIASLVRGDLDALVTTVIMQEGIDIPSLESVVVASGGKSAIAALQKIGRGMRSDDGRKETFEVWDFDDSGHTWLERHTKQRVKAYRDEGFNVEILT